MSSKLKICQHCSKEFVIRAQDKEFYQRVNAPEPVFCPQCRMRRRLAHRNERTLYPRTCDKCKKQIISIYPAKTPWPVYCHTCWWADDWDAKEYGQEYNPKKPFFEQFQELQSKVPRIGLLSITSVNSDYTNNSADNKDCYMIFAAEQCEDSLYSRLIQRCRSVVDACFLYDSELCYECVDCRRCYNCLFSERCQGSNDLLFCFNLKDSQNCIFSSNLNHASYRIENRQYTKEEFERKKKEILTSYETIEKAKQHFEEIKTKALVKFAFQTKCVNATGDYLFNCHDTTVAFDAENTKSCGYLADIAGAIDCYDGNNMYYTPELCLELMGIIKCYNSKYSKYVFYCTEVEYCDSCYHSESCFGCIGFKKGVKHCILNKEYSSDEYKKIKEQIVASMKKGGEYGMFFPPSISPFGYNETLIKDYAPLLKEEALKQGFRWQDEETGTFGKETIAPANMPSRIEETKDDIVSAILKCEKCSRNFRITKAELEFYRNLGLPLPHQDFECRHQARMAKRTPRHLWHRDCQCGGEYSDNNMYKNTAEHTHTNKHCPHDFDTAYHEKRKEIVYCEQCYLAEVV